MYIVHVQPKNSSVNNPIHEMIEGREAQILMVEEGSRGFFDFLDEDGEMRTISTSKIVKVVEEGDNVRVETLHTDYLFERSDGAYV